ncbi:MAG: hypothetical protein ACLSVD_08265 [Eggerthellaceae bacterium]
MTVIGLIGRMGTCDLRSQRWPMSTISSTRAIGGLDPARTGPRAHHGRAGTTL